MVKVKIYLKSGRTIQIRTKQKRQEIMNEVIKVIGNTQEGYFKLGNYIIPEEVIEFVEVKV